MVLGINTIRDALSGTPKLEGESRLPNYFPVEPKGCEKHSARLFECLAGPATEKAREMEKAGLHKSWYPDVTPTPGDEKAARLVREQEEKGGAAATSGSGEQQRLPTKNDNPLDECLTFIAYYKRCCDRELKKKHNWILTEPYRVQEEYRYQQQQQQLQQK